MQGGNLLPFEKEVLFGSKYIGKCHLHGDPQRCIFCDRHGRLSLYEHQSTYSANLTLRFFVLCFGFVLSNDQGGNLYKKKGVKLPSPRFLIFYNGEEKMEERKILRLSELYSIEDKMPALELEAVMLNINQGYNLELLDASETLQEYVKYTQRVRKYAGEMELTEAVERAITECIREGILADFFEAEPIGGEKSEYI